MEVDRVRVTVEYDLLRVYLLIRRAFGENWFTARQLGKLLYIQPKGASALLRRMWELGLVERRKGNGGLQYKARAGLEELAGAQP